MNAPSGPGHTPPENIDIPAQAVAEFCISRAHLALFLLTNRDGYSMRFIKDLDPSHQAMLINTKALEVPPDMVFSTFVLRMGRWENHGEEAERAFSERHPEKNTNTYLELLNYIIVNFQEIVHQAEDLDVEMTYEQMVRAGIFNL